jgi:hypothetical protein
MWLGKPPIQISMEAVSLNSLRSILILAVLNAIFLAVNTIDAAYLWIGAGIPKDVTYAEFVHDGVYNLITCVLISALVLTVIFDQSKQITANKPARVMAIVWIIQNLFLIASVALRLKLYVDEYQLSSLRVYVGFFLLLVCVGFILLTVKILRDKSFHWLVFSNVLATFALFYIVQFLNVDGWVANYNVERWLKNPGKELDITYLSHLGPPAWPALAKAAAAPGGLSARNCLDSCLDSERFAAEHRPWQSWQWRQSALFAQVNRSVSQ